MRTSIVVKSIIVICISCISVIASAQSEKEIIRKYLSAMKKSVSDSAVKSMELSGEFNMKKFKFPGHFYFRLPKSMRVELTIQSLTFIIIGNDSMKWEYDPFNDKHKITNIDRNANDADTGNKRFDFNYANLIHHEKNKVKVKLINRKKLDSLDVFHLELTSSKEGKASVYINTKTNLIYRIVDDAGERHFADYIEVDGYVFPRYVRSGTDEMEMRFNQVILDATIPDSLFQIPSQAIAASKAANTKTDVAFKECDVLLNAGNYEKAETCYTSIIKKDSDNHHAYNSRGHARLHAKKYYEAIGDFTAALEYDPAFVAAFNARGLAKFYLGDHEGAVSDYSKALELDSTYKVSFKNRGHSYIHSGEHVLAVSDFGKAIMLDPNDGESHYKYAVSLAQLEKYDEALQSYREALRHREDLEGAIAELHNYKGVSEYQLEQFDSARHSFSIAVRLEPVNLQYVENYGRAFYAMEDYESANNQFERCLEAGEPNSAKEEKRAEIINLIGLCKYFQENYKGAIKDFTSAIEIHEVATYFDNRAEAKEQLEDYVGAIDDYSESIRLYPNDPSIFYRRGLVKIHTSKKLEGCMDLATAHEMNYEPAEQAILKNCP